MECQCNLCFGLSKLAPSSSPPLVLFPGDVMATISTHLRTFKEPNKEQALRLFFSLPPNPSPAEVGDSNYEKFDINSVLTLESQEDSYVRPEPATCPITCAHAPALFSFSVFGYSLHHRRPESSIFYRLISASARSTAAPYGLRSPSRASAVSNGSIRAQRARLRSLSSFGMERSSWSNSPRSDLLQTCSAPTCGKR